MDKFTTEELDFLKTIVSDYTTPMHGTDAQWEREAFLKASVGHKLRLMAWEVKQS